MAFGNHGLHDARLSSNKMGKSEKNDFYLDTTVYFEGYGEKSIARPWTRHLEKTESISETEIIYKRHHRRPITRLQTEYLKSRSAIDDSGASKLRKIAHNTIDEVAGPGKVVSSLIETTEAIEDKDEEKAWCIAVLNEYGLLSRPSRKCPDTEPPGVVGDGSSRRICKVCGGLEDATGTLICDMCEESFHMSCCNPKVKSVPVEDYWYCPTCRRKRKRQSTKAFIERTNSQRRSKFQDKAYLFKQMLENDEAYASQVRIGTEYQATIPDSTGNAAESSLIGVVLSREEKILEKELSEQNLKNNVWPKDWKPAKSLQSNAIQNWLQCQALLYKKGEVCSDGQKAKEDIICGKWRRAPLSQVQNEKWDCSCAVVWDPHHADCAVPQELETTEILRHLKDSNLMLLEWSENGKLT